jgi:hypothetical protein
MRQDDLLCDEERLALGLPGPERYRFFMESFGRTGSLWIAESDEAVLTLFDDNESELLPVWPSRDLLTATLGEDQISSGYKPVRRTMAHWQKRTLPR